jgi:hypothetical protein
MEDIVNSIIQLNPTITVETPLGTGRALLVLDYGMDVNTCWVIALDTDGQIKHFDSNQIRLQKNYTYGSGTGSGPATTASK